MHHLDSDRCQIKIETLLLISRMLHDFHYIFTEIFPKFSVILMQRNML